MKKRFSALLICLLLCVCALAEGESYPVKTLLNTATFPEKPEISNCTALLGADNCRLSEYDLVCEDTEMLLLTLSFPDTLSQGLADADDATMQSILRMSMDILESLGFVVYSQETPRVLPCESRMLSVMTSEKEYFGWAEISFDQIVYVLSETTQTGYEFLLSVFSPLTEGFVSSDARTLTFGGVTLTFPEAPEVSETAAVCGSLRAEILPLPDLFLLLEDEAASAAYVQQQLPSGAVDLAESYMGSVYTVSYAYDSLSGAR